MSQGSAGIAPSAAPAISGTHRSDERSSASAQSAIAAARNATDRWICASSTASKPNRNDPITVRRCHHAAIIATTNSGRMLGGQILRSKITATGLTAHSAAAQNHGSRSRSGTERHANSGRASSAAPFSACTARASSGGVSAPAIQAKAMNAHRLRPGLSPPTLIGMPSHCQGPPASTARASSNVQRSSALNSMSFG